MDHGPTQMRECEIAGRAGCGVVDPDHDQWKRLFVISENAFGSGLWTVQNHDHFGIGGKVRAGDRIETASQGSGSVSAQNENAQPQVRRLIDHGSILTHRFSQKRDRPPHLARHHLARPEGFEPPTLGLEVRRSIPLSYGRLVPILPLQTADMRAGVIPQPEKIFRRRA